MNAPNRQKIWALIHRGKARKSINYAFSTEQVRNQTPFLSDVNLICMICTDLCNQLVWNGKVEHIFLNDASILGISLTSYFLVHCDAKERCEISQ